MATPAQRRAPHQLAWYGLGPPSPSGEATLRSGVLDELAAIGWVFGGPDHWQLIGVGHSHTSHTSPSGLLGGGR